MRNAIRIVCLFGAAILCLDCCPAAAVRLPRDADYSEETDCTADDDCKEGFVCEDYECTCSDERVSWKGRCLKMATESQNECEIPEQCKELDGRVCFRGKCVGMKGLGDSCGLSAECNSTANLVCNSGSCRCSEDHVEFEEDCLKRATKLGDDCVEGIQCEGVNGSCANGTCQVQAAPENATAICEDENAEMVNGTCRCKEGYVESEDGKSCLKMAGALGEPCSSHSQCETVSGTCIGGFCINVVLSSMALPGVVAVGSPCKENSDCRSVNDAVCLESICQCSDHFLSAEDQSKCVPYARVLGEDCQMDKQCSQLPGSSCINGKCRTPEVAAAGVVTRTNGAPSVALPSGLGAVVAVVLASSFL